MTNSLVLNILYTIPVGADKCFVRGEQTFWGTQNICEMGASIFFNIISNFC